MIRTEGISICKSLLNHLKHIHNVYTVYIKKLTCLITILDETVVVIEVKNIVKESKVENMLTYVLYTNTMYSVFFKAHVTVH